jgi:glycosidase
MRRAVPSCRLRTVLAAACGALALSVLAGSAVAADTASAPTAMPTASAPAVPPASDVVHVAWSRHANIYEVNIRQYTKEGTFKAFEPNLKRLKAMGVDIVWVMPSQPIGVKNRKGTLGSYYAIKDYTAVNPEFGTLEDFRHLVKTAHGLGMHVILDWVANHTAWDHPWVTQHPDWYKKNKKGEIYPVTFNEGQPNQEQWTDVVGLDYSNHALWEAMIGAMSYWMKEADVDGFRCDVAGMVPTPFWNEARKRLDRIKPVFMLAEWSEPDLHDHAFDMTYNWELFEVMKKVAAGKGDARDLRAYVQHPRQAFPADAYRMNFTSNHDINSWDGSDLELYGKDKFALFATLAATLPGMPLIYGGQEAGNAKRLEFFEKDPIAWPAAGQAPALESFYAQLLARKHRAEPLANGVEGAPAEVLATGNDAVFAFRRAKGGQSVQVLANVSAKAQTFTLAGESKPRTLAPWGVDVQQNF